MNKSRIVFFTFACFFSLLTVFFPKKVFCEEEVISEKTVAEDKQKNVIAGDKQKKQTAKMDPMEHPAMIFVRNLMEDKYPVLIDFGAEPGEHGSTKFLRVQYNWTKKISSNIYGGYKTEADYQSLNAYTILQNNTRQIDAILFPFIYYIGDGSPRTRNPLIRLDSGAFYTYKHETAQLGLFDADGAFMGEDNKNLFFTVTNGTYTHMFGPMFGCGAYFPFLRILQVGLESRISPLYCTFYESIAELSSPGIDDGEPFYSDITLHFNSWSSPFFEQSIFVDVLKYFRLKTKLTFLQLTEKRPTTDSEGKWSEDMYISRDITFRYGVEIVKPAISRKKQSHLSFGVYYEHEWSKPALADDLQHSKRLVLCFGT